VCGSVLKVKKTNKNFSKVSVKALTLAELQVSAYIISEKKISGVHIVH